MVAAVAVAAVAVAGAVVVPMVLPDIGVGMTGWVGTVEPEANCCMPPCCCAIACRVSAEAGAVETLSDDEPVTGLSPSPDEEIGMTAAVTIWCAVGVTATVAVACVDGEEELEEEEPGWEEESGKVRGATLFSPKNGVRADAALGMADAAAVFPFTGEREFSS